MAPMLERLDGTDTSSALCELLQRDGGVVVEDALTTAQLDGLN